MRTLRQFPIAEDRGANADFRRTFLDRNFKIVGHSHRKNGQRRADAPLESIAQLAQAAEGGPRSGRVAHRRRNAHQAAEFKMRQREDSVGYGVEIFFANAGFRGSCVEAHFDQHAKARGRRGIERRPRAFEASRELEAIERIDGVKQSGGARGFVALQMADEMPDGVEIGDFGALRFPFLNAALAEMARACGVGFADQRSGKSFGHGDQRDVFGVAAGARGGLRDAGERIGQILGNGEIALHVAHFIRDGSGAKYRPTARRAARG